jgi:hypothetical protein
MSKAQSSSFECSCSPPTPVVEQGVCIHFIIKRVALFKLSLLLKIDLQNTQTLRLNSNGKYIQK